MACELHNKDFTMYDETLNKLLCVDCLVLNPKHRANSLLNLETALRKFKGVYSNKLRDLMEISKSLDTTRAQGYKDYHETMSFVSQLQSSIKNYRDEIIQLILDTFESFGAELEKKLKKLSLEFEEEIKGVDEQIFGVENFKKQIYSITNLNDLNLLIKASDGNFNAKLDDIILKRHEKPEFKVSKVQDEIYKDCYKGLIDRVCRLKQHIASKTPSFNTIGQMRRSSIPASYRNIKSLNSKNFSLDNLFKKPGSNQRPEIDMTSMSDIHMLTSHINYGNCSQLNAVDNNYHFDYKDEHRNNEMSDLQISALRSNIVNSFNTVINIGNVSSNNAEITPPKENAQGVKSNSDNNIQGSESVPVLDGKLDAVHNSLLLSPKKESAAKEKFKNFLKTGYKREKKAKDANTSLKPVNKSFQSNGGSVTDRPTGNKWRMNSKRNIEAKRNNSSLSFNRTMLRQNSPNHAIVVGGTKSKDMRVRFISSKNMAVDHLQKLTDYSDVQKGYSTVFNDRLYIIGGKTRGSVYSDVISFDLTKKKPVLAFRLKKAKYGFAAMETEPGKILLMGGKSTNGELLSEIELVDLKAKCSSIVSKLDNPITDSCALLASDRLNGFGNELLTKLSKSYSDPDLLNKRDSLTSNSNKQKNMRFGLLIGGSDSDKNALATIQLVNLSTYKVVDTIEMTQPRKNCSPLVMEDKLYIMGGKNVQPLSSIETLQDGKCVHLFDLNKPRYGFCSYVIDSNCFIIFGGKGHNKTHITAAEMVDISTNEAVMVADELGKEKICYSSCTKIN